MMFFLFIVFPVLKIFILGDLSTAGESDRESSTMIIDDQQIPSKTSRLVLIEYFHN